MKYKLGDKVKVKSQKWYKENKDADEIVRCDGFAFFSKMVAMCGKVVTIKRVHQDCYDIEEFPFPLTDPMIEGLADARETPVEHPCDWLKRGLNLPDGYEIQDENGNVINTKKITLVKKKPKYPTTFEDCVEVLQLEFNPTWSGVPHRQIDYKDALLYNLKKLLICRDAYWKIAGWKPDWEIENNNRIYTIIVSSNVITKSSYYHNNHILAFQTEEMRDAFYENFKELINECKELL